jgi:hypothetical protein
MMALAHCGGETCTKDMPCVACRAASRHGRSIGTVPGIPVRRYGSVPPPPDDEPAWEVESLSAPPPATIAEYGGRAVLLAALAAAVLAGCVLYLH